MTERFKSVLIISLNRPEKQNALNKSMLQCLANHLKQFEQDTNYSVAVINGIGGNFCCGYDLDELKLVATHDPNEIRSHLIVCIP